MGGAIDSPNTEQLGYFRRRSRRDTGEPSAAQERAGRRRWKWVSIALLLVVALLVVFYATATWRSTARHELAADAIGTWIRSGSDGSVLAITQPSSGGGAGATAHLSFRGSVDGRQVSGAVEVPGFPSLSTVLHLTLFGEQWELRLPSERVMTLTEPSGRVITFLRP